jgi:hypothetical protein
MRVLLARVALVLLFLIFAAAAIFVAYLGGEIG